MTNKATDSGAIHLGLDVGSVSANLVLLDDKGRVLEESYTRTRGRPWQCVESLLTELTGRGLLERAVSLSLTGSAAKAMAPVLGGPHYNEIIAHARSGSALHPQVRTIIDMGGEDSQVLLLAENGGGEIEDFAMNSACAAGTGSFLDQQANRLGFTIEDFSQQALKSPTPPRVAGRCSVFAKTDMIHLQQEATPDYDIVAGLCFALIRNLKSNIARGKDLSPPVAFHGGVAANAGVRRALLEILGLEQDQLIIPDHYAAMGAVGAALLSLDAINSGESGLRREPGRAVGLKAFRAAAGGRRVKADRLEPLALSANHRPDKGAAAPERVGRAESATPLPVWLGVDVGSISTNVVLVDDEGRLLAKEYLMTAGRPLEAVKEGLARLGRDWDGRVEVLGAATTGSGRYLTGEFIGADLVRNEITAQATAAAFIDPEVDTIFEIGGQDSKYISLKNGAIVDFTMNKVCAAGTGSFLEEQAEKLGIAIKGQFGQTALSSTAPIAMGERCTVFMESDIVHHQQQGAPLADIVAGLSYSIVHNYLNKVVGERPVGRKIFYQGATASNLGIVAAFEKVVGRPIQVPPDNDVTGAIGAALLARRERDWRTSKFKGFGVARAGYEIKTFECQGCSNRCQVRRVRLENVDRPLYYGSRCDKYELDTVRADNDLPDLIAERQAWLTEAAENPAPSGRKADLGRVGLPQAMYFQEYLPFFATLLKELGFEVVLSGPSTKQVIHTGLELVAAETCFPVKAAHGHLQALLEAGVEKILLPALVNTDRPQGLKAARTSICPYSAGLTYLARAAFDFQAAGVRIIDPMIRLGEGDRLADKGLKELCRRLGAPPGRLKKAKQAAWAAQEAFRRRCRERGAEVLAQLPADRRAMVFISRPYNGLDPGLNLGLHRKLRDLGVTALPMDFLDLDGVGHIPGTEKMYWRYGQKILAAAELVKADHRLEAIYITNFGCGPDSFISHFFRDRMAGQPFLELEIDEHSADVGAATRLEAFLDSAANHTAPEKGRADRAPVRRGPQIRRQGRRTIYVPAMTDHAQPFAAVFRRFGMAAEALPESDAATVAWGRKCTSGKECYPCILTTGDMVKFLKNNGHDPDKAAFFVPTGQGPCRFGCYNRFQRMVLDELGYANVPVYSPNQGAELYDELEELIDLPENFSRLAWQSISATDALQKKLWQTRPYEVKKGEADGAYARALAALTRGFEQGDEPVAALRRAAEIMDDVALAGQGSRPLIGLIGEVYTRTNRFANLDVIRRIEELGGEAWVSPFGEWVLYVNQVARNTAWRQRNLKSWLGVVLTDRVQRKLERELHQVFENSVNRLHEPKVGLTLDLARPYVDSTFEAGEVALSMGKSAEFVAHGASGIVNVIPFSCMPGNIVHALMKKFRDANGRIPYITVACDGQEESNLRTRLEAFMHQSNTRHKSQAERAHG